MSAKIKNDSVVERLVMWVELDDCWFTVETGTRVPRASLYSLHVRRCVDAAEENQLDKTIAKAKQIENRDVLL